MRNARDVKGNYLTFSSVCEKHVLPFDPCAMDIFETKAMSIASARRYHTPDTYTLGEEFLDLYQIAMKPTTIEDALHCKTSFFS